MSGMHPVELAEATRTVKCQCVGKHVPLPTVLHKHHIVPKYLGGGNEQGNIVLLCPTTHDNVHSLMRQYAKYNGRPPGSVRKHYSDYVQALAFQGWNGAKALNMDDRVLSELVLDNTTEPE